MDHNEYDPLPMTSFPPYIIPPTHSFPAQPDYQEICLSWMAWGSSNYLMGWCLVV